MRFDGTDTALMILPEDKDDGEEKEDFMSAFRKEYKEQFGFLLDEKNVIVDDIKVGFRSMFPLSTSCVPYVHPS